MFREKQQVDQLREVPGEMMVDSDRPVIVFTNEPKWSTLTIGALMLGALFVAFSAGVGWANARMAETYTERARDALDQGVAAQQRAEHHEAEAFGLLNQARDAYQRAQHLPRPPPQPQQQRLEQPI